MQPRRYAWIVIVLFGVAGLSCRKQPDMSTTSASPQEARQDLHSYANPEQVRVRHVDLDLAVDFDKRELNGSALLTISRRDASAPLVLDTRDLAIERVETSANGREFAEAGYEIGAADKILGAPLSITLPADVRQVRIRYRTSPSASGVQWLTPAQTAGKKHPFLFTQSEAIHARSWIPLQDSPGVRVTYSARIRKPKDLMAVMSAEMDPNAPRSGDYRFRMRQAIPSYLIALAVGDLEFRAMGERTGVWAEPSIVEKAAWEFADTEKMMQAVESLYGPYQWGRYDILVLPPSFPFGGMENPRLTFATPTILAGDRSLVTLIAHELAHSWSGNLVTNATWRDFWLNEGFTVYLEQRIQEKVFGPRRAAMEAALSVQELEREMATLAPGDQVLHIDLKGRDPDYGFTHVPYVKGALFLRRLEEVFGRERFDDFLKSYFEHFQFQSITTAQFVEYLNRHLLGPNPELAAQVRVDEWIEKPGLPETTPRTHSEALVEVREQATRWLRSETAAKDLPTGGWSTQEWLQFLTALPAKLDAKPMRELDEAFGLTGSGNPEILQQWLLMAVRNEYQPAYARIEQFLTDVGRRKYIKPIYEELAKTPVGRQRALDIYRKARPGYHPIAAATIDGILKLKEE